MYGCDFSHAPTNGIEATFSRNTFANNLVMECWHGVWGGYSYDTKILGNLFAYDGEGIAIEHGQNNAIRGNAFYRDAAGIHVWQNEKQDPNWGYPKHHDTASHGYDVSGNVFTQIHRTRPPGTREIGGAVEGAAVELKATSDFDQGANRYGPVGALADVRGPLKSYRFGGARLDPALLSPAAARAQADHPSEWAWRRIESLGAGWQPSVEGRHMIGGPRDGFLPQLMKPDGNDILPYPDGEAAYRARFETDWNPLAAPKAVSIGAEPAGHALIAPTAETLALAPPPLPGGMDPYLKPGALRGRAYILVDQWGPYDFRAPRLWPRNTTEPGDAASLDLEVLGPRGSWTVRHVEGGTLSATSGKVPGRVELRRTGAGRVKIELEYLGGKTVDYRGIETPARRPVPFQYAEFKVPIDWHVRFYRYNKASQEPRTQIEAFRSLLSGAPLAQMDTTSLDLAPGRIPREVPNDYFATIAEGSFEIEPGDYVIDTTSDDGCRVYLDGKLLVDAWKYQVPTLYSKTVHLGGKHQLRVEHFQIDGYWTLKVAIRPAKP
ncbi:MAG TPA: PA14 domain-containing protein [Chthonomonadaceae bacterium]|nr:PA14 domain-containing protein [Chthonomonadaceae bacterium]